MTLKQLARCPFPVPSQQHRQQDPKQLQLEPLLQKAMQPGLGGTGGTGTLGGQTLNLPGPSCSRK